MVPTLEGKIVGPRDPSRLESGTSVRNWKASMAIPKTEASSRSAPPRRQARFLTPRRAKPPERATRLLPAPRNKRPRRTPRTRSRTRRKRGPGRPPRKRPLTRCGLQPLTRSPFSAATLRSGHLPRSPRTRPPRVQRNKAESMADGVPQRRSNPLPPPPRPDLKPSNIAAVGQRNRAESMADGVAQRRSNPLPPAPKPSNRAAAGQRAGPRAWPTGSRRGARTRCPRARRQRAGSSARSIPSFGAPPTPRRPPPGRPHRPGSSATSTLSCGNAASSDRVPAPAAAAGRFAAAVPCARGWERLRRALEPDGDRGSPVEWVRAGGRKRVGSGPMAVADGCRPWTGPRTATTGRLRAKAWTATGQQGIRREPAARDLAMEAGLRGRPWPAAWDAGQGVVWGAAQVAATGVEVVKLGGRITNATSYLLTDERVRDRLEDRLAVGQRDRVGLRRRLEAGDAEVRLRASGHADQPRRHA